MKLAISTSGNDMDSQMDMRFGRAEKFMIYETTSGEYRIVDNDQNLNAVQGAGIQAAGKVIDEGVASVITGHCGPKAFQMLKESDIRVYTSGKISVKAAIERFRTGCLKTIKTADVEGHWI